MTFESLPAALARHARETPARVAVLMGDDACSYGALWRRVEQATSCLAVRHGVGPGDRVAFLGTNHPDQLVLLAALMLRGAMLVPLNYRLAAPELRAIVAHAGASLVFADGAFATLAAELGREVQGRREGERREARSSRLDRIVVAGDCPHVRIMRREALADAAPVASSRLHHCENGDDFDHVDQGADFDQGDHGDGQTPALLVYTSGTTGTPKGAVHTQAGLYWNAQASIAMHDMVAEDRVLTVLPLFHVGGLCIQTVPALYAGATVILHPRFDPGAWLRAIAAARPTLSLMVPATMRAVIEHPDWSATDLGSLRILGAGSSTIPSALIEAFHARGVPVCQIYGATETGPVSIVLRADEAFAHVGAAGRPAAGCSIRLTGDDGNEVAPGTVGEICVRGPNVMHGYWRDPANPALADGWFRTGDLASRDADGYYAVVGRAQDMIISGGENIYPAEIENVLAGIPEIAEAVAIGVPDPQWGEVPVAVVVLRPDALLSDDAMRAAFEGVLARFKHPRRIVVRAALPRNAMGKVQKKALIAEIERMR